MSGPSAADGFSSARLAEADRALCKLEGAVASFGATDAYTDMHLRCEAVHSSTLSGARSSLQELLSEECDLEEGSGPGAQTAAGQCLLATKAALSASPMSAGALERAYRILSPENGEPDAQASRHVRDLIAGASRISGSYRDVPGLVRAGLAQAELEAHRPERKGASRFARAVVPVMLRGQRGFPLGTSAFLVGQLSKYRRLSRAAARQGGLREWTDLFLQAVATSAARGADEIARVAALRERDRDLIAASLGHAVSKGLAVHNCLLRDPTVTVARVRRITGTSYVAANLLVSRLVDLGILEEFTGFRRNRVFRYGTYLRAFESAPDVAVPWAAIKPAAEQSLPRPRSGTATPAKRPARRMDRKELPRARPEKRDKPSPPRPRPSRPSRSPQLSDHLL